MSRRGYAWLAWAGIGVIYVALRANLLDVPLGRDEGGYGYVGQLILSGDLPYRDALDHRPPIIFYLYAFALLFVPPTAVGIHAFLQLFNFATVLAVAGATREAFGGTAGRWAGLCFAVISASPAIQGFAAATEMFMMLPLALSLWAVLRWRRTPRAGWLVGGGACAALACWTKQPAATSVLWIAGLAAVGAWQVGGTTGRLTRVCIALACFAAGGLAISLPIILYFVAHGLGEELYYWSFAHSALYSATVQVMWERVGDKLWGLVRGDFVVLGLAALGVVVGFRRRRADGLFLAGFLLLSLVGTLPGKAYKHYFCQLLPALCLAAGPALAWLTTRPREALARAAVAALATAAIVGVPVAVHSGYYVSESRERIARVEFGLNPFFEAEAIAAYLRRAADPGDRVLVVGSEPQIHFLSGLRSATPFIYFYPMVRDYPRHVEFQERTWRELSADPPEWIIRTDVPTSVMWDGRAQRTLLDNITELVRNDYALRGISTVEIPAGKFYQTPNRQTLVLATTRAEKAKHRLWVYQRRRDGARTPMPAPLPTPAPAGDADARIRAK